MTPSEIASSILKERRQKALRDQEKRQAEVYKKLPQVREIDKKIRDLGFSSTKAALKGEDTGQAEEKIKDLAKQRLALLREGGYPEDYLEVHYSCKKCQDTGFVGNEVCSCRRQIIIEEKYSRSNIKNLLTRENFRTFDQSLFSKNLDQRSGAVPYDNMSGILDNIRDYIETFGRGSKNLYIYGDVGRGKTFLVNCIAKEILDREFSVVYFSATRLFAFMNDYFYAFSERKEELKEDYDFIMTCDLLIIDDLGAEKTRDSDPSNLFDIINDRLINQKPIIFSSNFSPNDLGEMYGARVQSRIIGTSDFYRIIGDDLRIKMR